MSAAKPTVYAIDFGTSNSLLAAANSTRVFAPIVLDPAAVDPTVMRSAVFSLSRDAWTFGQEAVDLYAEQASEGRFFRSLKKFLPDPGFQGTHVHGKNYSIIDLVSLFLKDMRQKANQFFDTDVTNVILGRPAAFSLDPKNDDLAERRLEAAAQLAGFKMVSFCHEPVAAAYEYQKQMSKEQTVLIADFGGGTSDFSILRMGPRAIQREDILSIGGISLAGDAYDGSLMKHRISPHFGSHVRYKMPSGSNVLEVSSFLIAKLNSPADISFLGRRDVMSLLENLKRWSLGPEDKKRMSQLIALAEEGLGFSIYKQIESTKKDLSTAAASMFSYHHDAGIDVEEVIKAQDFENFSEDITDRIMTVLQNVLQSAQVRPEQIDLVCLTGGTAQLKGIKNQLETVFGQEKVHKFQFFHSIISGLAEKAKEIA